MVFKLLIFVIFAIGVQCRPQVQGTFNTNPDGSANVLAKVPMIETDTNVLSGIISGSGMKDGGYGSVSGGLQLENENGHSLTLSKTHIPSFGDQLTAAGKFNFLNTDDHNLNANIFTSHNSPLEFSGIPEYNTYGGNIDYMYKDKVGATLGASYTPLFQQKDYSAMANLNIFKDSLSSLDLNAGATRSISPFETYSNWQPTFGMTYRRNF